MIDFTIALPGLSKLLEQFREKSTTLETSEAEAIKIVWTAIDNTKIHLAKIRSGEVKKRAPNPELVELWRNAALRIFPIDPDLGYRLSLKAEFWSDPENWDEEEVNHADISMKGLTHSARKLMQQLYPAPSKTDPESLRPCDIFLSHSREDYDAVAGPLADLLEQKGYAIWIDRGAIQVGDSISEEINQAIRSCRFGVLVLSPSFLSQPWTKLELNTFLALEGTDQRKWILPVWHQLDKSMISLSFPLLLDRIAAETEDGLEKVANMIADKIGPAPD